MSVSRSSGVSLGDLKVHLLEEQQSENPSSKPEPVTSGSFQGREVTPMSSQRFAALMGCAVTAFFGASALTAYAMGYLSF